MKMKMKTVIRFAIAEDNEIVRKGIINIILDFGGYALGIEASNGEELFHKLFIAKSLPDIVVLDISMPIWNGYETLDAIRKNWPEMKVLILTMHKHELGIIKMLRSGANGYLLKNSPPKELQRAMRTILVSGLYFSEVASSQLYRRIHLSELLPSLSEIEIQL